MFNIYFKQNYCILKEYSGYIKNISCIEKVLAYIKMFSPKNIKKYINFLFYKRILNEKGKRTKPIEKTNYPAKKKTN